MLEVDGRVSGSSGQWQIYLREWATEENHGQYYVALGVDALRWIGERPLYETLRLPASEEELLAVTPRYLNFRAYTILGGTTEIQTGILARAMLGL